MSPSFPVKAFVAVGVIGLLSCDHAPTAPRLDQLALEVVSGDGQTAVVGTQVAPLVVKVTSAGNPVIGQILNFRVTSGGGSVYGGTELTDSDGIAQELWTLGADASQAQRVEVRAVESSSGAEKVFATFTATAVPDKPDSLFATAGNTQTTVAGTTVAALPTVKVSDKYGNPIAGMHVTFAVSSGGGSATGLLQTTTAAGLASVGSWTLGPAAGPNTLVASTPSVSLSGSPVTFTAIGTTGAAARLIFLSGNNQRAAPGVTLPQNPAVQVVDPNGNGVPNVAVTFTITSGGGSINGVGSVTTLTGAGTPLGAAAVSWTLGSASGTNTLQATAVGLQGSPITFTATAGKALYVVNNRNNSITIYATGATGNAAPTTTIAGANTGLLGPTGIALDAAGNVYVANSGNNSITVYAAGASGNATPTATITGGLSRPFALALDAAGNLYVANGDNSSITVYAAGAAGNTAPTATIAGGNTGLVRPDGIALDAAGNVYVANNGNNSITVYAAGASGNATPTATITGGVTAPYGIALDAAGNLYVVNATNPSSITIYATGATGNAAPTATIAGGNTGLLDAAGIALDAAGTIYVANGGNNSITLYAARANGNATPTATITGANTGLGGPWMITF